MKDQTKPTVVERLVKHVFTDAEQADNGRALARANATIRGIEAEFTGIKKDYQARTATAEASVDSLSTDIQNGFKMHKERCVVIFRPKDRTKDLFLESTILKEGDAGFLRGVLSFRGPSALTEDMTADDFQAELIQAESKFDGRVEIPLFTPPDGTQDSGVLVVGRFGERWFSALRVKIGKLTLDQRLDTEQKSSKQRADALNRAIKEYKEWTRANLKDLADGFQAGAQAVWEAEKEKVE